MVCSDCGQDTLSDGVCISCTNNRIEGYPRLKRLEEQLDKRIEYLKNWKGVKFEGQDRVVEELQKIQEGKT